MIKQYMKKLLAPLLVSVFVFGFFSLQIVSVTSVYAQWDDVIVDPSGPSSNSDDVIVDPSGPSSNDAVLENPLGDTDTIPLFIEKLLGLVMKIGVPIVALFIIYSGFLFVLARGKPAELTHAKETFLYTVLGAAILLGAWVLAQAINGTIEALQ